MRYEDPWRYLNLGTTRWLQVLLFLQVLTSRSWKVGFNCNQDALDALCYLRKRTYIFWAERNYCFHCALLLFFYFIH